MLFACSEEPALETFGFSGWAGWLADLADLAGWLGWLADLAAGPKHWILHGCLLGWSLAGLAGLADCWAVLSSIRGRGHKWYASLGEAHSVWVSPASCSQVGQTF